MLVVTSGLAGIDELKVLSTLRGGIVDITEFEVVSASTDD
jgi:hypothetical protein